MADLCFFLILISGSILGAVIADRKFEETIPITSIGIVLLLFGFGLIHQLKSGIFAVGILAFVFYAVAVTMVIKCKQYQRVKKNILTAGFGIYILIYFFLIYIDYHLLASNWDEFSHWMDCVKAMTDVNDFITNPASHSAFQSYPPGVALFQYFYQRIFLFVNADARFSEWRMYLAYQLLILAVFMPLVKVSGRRSTMRIMTGILITFFLPLAFYSNFYTSVYVDPFIGMVEGAGVLYIIIHRDRDLISHIYITLLCAVLVLAKDAGSYFATFLAVAYSYDLWKS